MVRSLIAVLAVASCGAPHPTPPPRNAGTAHAPAVRPQPPAPSAASRWIAKLGEPSEIDRAITEIEQLGDPGAIEVLGELWLAQGRSPRTLQVLISLARPLTPAEATDRFFPDYAATGRPASWAQALPFLRRALLEVDEANPHSVDSAVKAAEALGEARLGLDALAALAARPVTKQLIAAQVGALRALGAFTGDRDAAAAALLPVVTRDLPPHPRTEKDHAKARLLEEKYMLALGTAGAAINALAELRVAAAATELVRALYRMPELFTQIRRALVATGPAAAAELRAALRGESASVTRLIADQHVDRDCGDAGGEPCRHVSAVEFYPAVVLGDFHDPAVVPDLLAVLQHPAAPVYFVDGQPGPTTQYHAVFDTLRKLGAPAAAEPVRARWARRGEPLETRILALGAYPFLARDDAGLPELRKLAADTATDETLRAEAATALARLSHDIKDIALLTTLATTYLDRAARAAKQAEAKRGAADAADRAFEAAKLAHDKAKVALLVIAHDESKTAQEIAAATAAAKRAEDAFRIAKTKHRDQVAPFTQLDNEAKAYVTYARQFQTHVGRIEIAQRCKTDTACFAAALKLGPAEAAANNAPYIADVARWTRDEQRALLAAGIDRAMLELGKQGATASAVTDALLDAAVSDDRAVRQSILLALPKIAQVPCGSCAAKLDLAIRAGEGKTTLADLDLETQVLRNYFAWAGGRTP